MTTTPTNADQHCPITSSAPLAQGLGELAERFGALIVLDEIRTNFRAGGERSTAMAPGGQWAALGGSADLYCMSKALGNGHPIAALVGTEVSRDGAAAVMATGTYWLSPAPMAAALACLNGLASHGAAATAHMAQLGAALGEGLTTSAARHGFDVTVSGPPAMPFLTFDDEGPHARPLAERWCATVAAGGSWLHPHHNWYISAAHTEEDIGRTLQAAECAFRELSQDKRRSG
uniref:Glutamate-1-semialdehyde 2,1-aminomutase n=1 Tax=Haptolina brevifila TaxID=156173 RepID=A0A7S2IL27_9EUKA|mmetsp:Transcript_67648/g.134218  ORF Transcript_67648/g.134218 Transcript_67648/m.134218 type:complete len:232 (+) Transcript_67648:126-821(+)